MPVSTVTGACTSISNVENGEQLGISTPPTHTHSLHPVCDVGPWLAERVVLCGVGRLRCAEGGTIRSLVNHSTVSASPVGLIISQFCIKDTAHGKATKVPQQILVLYSGIKPVGQVPQRVKPTAVICS